MQGSKVVERTARTRTKNPARVEKAREAKCMEKRATKERAEDRRATHLSEEYSHVLETAYGALHGRAIRRKSVHMA